MWFKIEQSQQGVLYVDLLLYQDSSSFNINCNYYETSTEAENLDFPILQMKDGDGWPGW